MAHDGRSEEIPPLLLVVGLVKNTDVLWRDILDGARPRRGSEHPIIPSGIVFGVRYGVGHHFPTGAGESTINDLRIGHNVLGVRIVLDEIETANCLIGPDEHLLVDELRPSREAVQELPAGLNDKGILWKRKRILDSKLIRIKVELTASQLKPLLINEAPSRPPI